jgi:anti-sigma factor (TIGR02949 family)
MRLRLWPRRSAASCSEVIAVLQEFLDGAVDAGTAARVERHLEACRRCGLEASVYREIKASLRRQRGDVDAATLDRLRAFVARVGEGGVPRSR